MFKRLSDQNFDLRTKDHFHPASSLIQYTQSSTTLPTTTHQKAEAQSGATYVSSYCYICVLILLCPHTATCVLTLLYMCPHTATYVSWYCCACVLILLHMCPRAAIHVSLYWYTCVAWYYEIWIFFRFSKLLVPWETFFFVCVMTSENFIAPRVWAVHARPRTHAHTKTVRCNMK